MAATREIAEVTDLANEQRKPASASIDSSNGKGVKDVQTSEEDKCVVNIVHKGSKYAISIGKSDLGSRLLDQIADHTGVPTQHLTILSDAFDPKKTIEQMKLFRRPVRVTGISPTDAASLADKIRNTRPTAPQMPRSGLQRAERLPPPGFENTENTCYMNASLQVLKSMPELISVLLRYEPDKDKASLPEVRLTVALKKLLGALNTATLLEPETRSISAQDFMNVIREIVPEFAAKAQDSNTYAHQDASEAFITIRQNLQRTLRLTVQAPSGGPDKVVPWVDQYMGASVESVRTCEDDGADEPVETVTDVWHQLSCHITIDVNHLYQSLERVFEDELTKNAPSLGRDAKFRVRSTLTRLPYYLPVQLLRFGWRNKSQQEGSKTKIMKRVTFPRELDMSKFCSPDLREKISPVRDQLQVLKSAEMDMTLQKNRAESQGKTEPEIATMIEDATAKIKEEKQKMGAIMAKVDPELTQAGSNPSGLYELAGVITHQGRSPDHGHYTSVVRDRDDPSVWWRFDDYKVWSVTEWHLETLFGGSGDDHGAFVLLYRSMSVPLS